MLLLACLNGPARAEPTEAESRAHMHYLAGKTLYGLGNYSDALRELLVGYSLAPKPLFLLNIGQCYRRLDDPVKAREMYAKYLRDTPDDDRERPQVEEVLKDLERQIAERAPPPVVVASPAPVVAPPVTTVVLLPPPPAKHKRRAWWAIPVALVGAAGLGVGLYFALKPSCTASLGCLSAGGN